MGIIGKSWVLLFVFLPGLHHLCLHPDPEHTQNTAVGVWKSGLLSLFGFSSPQVKRSALSRLFANQSHSLGVAPHLCLKSPCPWHEPQDLCPALSWSTQGKKNSTSAGELNRAGQACVLEREAAVITASLCGRSREFYCVQV